MCGKIVSAAGALLVVFGLGVAPAWADSIDLRFTRIGGVTESSLPFTDPTLVVKITNEHHLGGLLDPGKVRFEFRNEVPLLDGERRTPGDELYSSVAEVYFDDGTLFGISQLVNDPNFTDFFPGEANPGDLPGGNTLDPPFEASEGFLADAQGNPGRGLDYTGERLHIYFDLLAGQTYQDVLDAIALGGAPGGLRIGLHVHSIGLQQVSASYVNNQLSVVPTPGAALGGLALMGLVMCGRRRMLTLG